MSDFSTPALNTSVIQAVARMIQSAASAIRTALTTESSLDYFGL